eukprot:IDg3023t1
MSRFLLYAAERELPSAEKTRTHSSKTALYLTFHCPPCFHTALDVDSASTDCASSFAMAGINFNVDANAVIKSAANAVMTPIRRQRQECKMSKVLAMAKECTQRLQLGTWNVLLLEQDGPTYACLDVLASATASTGQSATDSGTIPDILNTKARRMAWELSDIESIFEWACKSTFDSKFDTGWDGLLDATKVEKMYLNKTRITLNHKIKQCGRRNVRLLIKSIQNIRTKDRVDERLPYVPHFMSNIALWSRNELGFYLRARKEVADWVLDSLNHDYAHVMHKAGRSPSRSERQSMYAVAEMLIDTLATLKIAEQSHVSIPDCNLEEKNVLDNLVYDNMPADLDPAESDLTIALCRMASVVQFHYRATLCRHRYREVLYNGIITGLKNINSRTNFARLVATCTRNEERKSSPVVWKTMESEGITLCSSFVDPNLEIANDAGIGLYETENEILVLMMRTLGGTIHMSHHLQLSFVQSLLDLRDMDSASMSRLVCMRNVRLIECGENGDRALVLPYLNTIILQLRSMTWAEDFDLKSQQPVSVYDRNSQHSGGAVRRVANILLVLDFNETSMPSVNSDKLRVLTTAAKAGQVFTKDLRNKLIQMSHIEHRVSIDALKLYARNVFPSETALAGALVREMAHDRLKMHTEIEKTRFPQEFDAYFDLFYWRYGKCSGNTVRWGSGVPLSGMELKKSGRECYTLLGAPRGCRIITVVFPEALTLLTQAFVTGRRRAPSLR